MMMKRLTCRALVVSMLALSFQTAGAAMIGADQVAGSDRAMVLGVLNRSEAAAQLQAQGLDPSLARERIAAMSDQEVRQLAADIHAAPAGADGGTILAVLLIGAAVWYFVYRR